MSSDMCTRTVRRQIPPLQDMAHKLLPQIFKIALGKGQEKPLTSSRGKAVKIVTERIE